MTRIRLTSTALAGRLARRSGRRATRRGVGLPLVSPARALTQQIVHRHTRFGDVLQSRQTVALHVHATFAAAGVVRSPIPPPLATTHRRPAVPGVPGPPRLPLAQRLALRETRVEAAPSPIRGAGASLVTRPATAATSVARSAPVIAAMPLTRRQDGGASRYQGGMAEAPQSDRPPATERGRPAAPVGRGATHHPSPSLADGELERLAGRVIESIDRRIAAQRERVGRF